jgi:sulfur-oxidizing protein SoxY
MQNRRAVLARASQVALMLGGLGLLPRGALAAYASAAFEAGTVADLMKALGAGAPVESKDVAITAPDVAENGAVVPVGLATTLPGARRLLLLVEKNPSILAAAFDVSAFVEPSFTIHVKMGQSSGVMAVALMADGRVLYARKEVEVTLGGCGG